VTAKITITKRTDAYLHRVVTELLKPGVGTKLCSEYKTEDMMRLTPCAWAPLMDP